MLLVTGGAGFIGSNFALDWLATRGESVVNVDKLTYAGNLANLRALDGDGRHVFVRADIGDRDRIRALLKQYRPRAVVNFAAESHVDRSILGPEQFIQANVVGTFRLLDEVNRYWAQLPERERDAFRFLHVSTDEVYGSLAAGAPAFTEEHNYQPNSPYAASKASSDHLVRAYHHTYGLPTLTTNCSNNYGPYQFPEKLIPLMIHHALAAKPLPVYGDGLNVRDWLYVGDHCGALKAVIVHGTPGETYNIGGNSERSNIEVVRTLCAVLDELRPESPIRPHAKLIEFVKDRPGHDLRYAIDTSKIRRNLGWAPTVDFAGGIRRTVEWYLGHKEWTDAVISGEYREWVETNYGDRA